MKLHHGLLSISDFAAYCGTTRQTLQYYDRIGLLSPIKVGEQGYRYYHPLQGHEYRMIHSFQGSGCSLDEIKQILDSTSIETLKDWVSKKQDMLELELKRIKREQIYLLRFGQFLEWANQYTLDEPSLFTLNRPIRYNAVSFEDPAELYSNHYFDMLLRYSAYCREKGAMQEYPYFFYVSREEMKGKLRFNKILCMPDEENVMSDAHTIIAPRGQYLMLRRHPDQKRKEDSRRAAYETMFRYLEEHGLKPYGGCVEQPLSVPRGLRTEDYHFSVVFIMPVVPADGGESGGGET